MPLLLPSSGSHLGLASPLHLTPSASLIAHTRRPHHSPRPPIPGVARALAGTSNGSILATFLLLALYAPVNADAKEMKKRLQSGKPVRPDEPLSYETVCQMVGRAGDASEMLVMVNLCSDVTVAADFASASELVDGGEIASSFLFGYLLKCLQEKHNISTIIKTIGGVLTFGRGSLGMPRPKALALLHMLRESLHACPTFTDEELRKLLPELGVYAGWAMPVGAAAAEARGALLSEMAMRGASLFHALSREVPWLRADVRYAHSADARPALLDAFAVHVVTDDARGTTDWGRALRAMLVAPSGAPTEAEVEGCRLSLASMLYTLFKLHEDANVRISPSKIASLPLEQLAAFAAEAATLAAGVADLGHAVRDCYDTQAAEDAVRGRTARVSAGLRALADGITSAAASFGGGASPGGGGGGGMSLRGSLGMSRKMTRDDAGGAPAADVRTPRLPPLSLRALDAASASLLSSHVLAELREAAEVCGARRYLHEPLLPSLYERLRQSAAHGEPAGLAHALRVCVAGSDTTLHKLIQAYAVLRCAYPELLEQRPLRVFLVPVGRPHALRLAGFLAQQDGWYRRHVFAPHCAGPPIVPHLILSSSGGGDGWHADGGGDGRLHGAGEPPPSAFATAPAAGAPTLPVAPLRATLTDYFRASRACLQVRLFEVACYTAAPPPPPSAASAVSMKRPTDAPFVTLVFGQSVEVVSVGGRDESGGPPVGATVCYTMSDPWGVPYQTPTTVAGRFACLSWHTFSSAPFHSPASGRLQMRCGLATKSAPASSKPPMRYADTASVHAGLGAGLGGAQDGSLTPRTPRGGGQDGKFGLLVDGEYYGPFAYCHIAPCTAPGTSEQLSLPLATFFPIGDDDASSDAL